MGLASVRVCLSVALQTCILSFPFAGPNPCKSDQEAIPCNSLKINKTASWLISRASYTKTWMD